MTENKSENFRLFWLCGQTGRKHPAGVAFFNESQGDYRLKIDTMPDDKMIFLKVSSMTEGMVHYRVEAAVKKNGKVSHRAEIGSGRAPTNDGYPITMDIGPFSRNLILEKAD